MCGKSEMRFWEGFWRDSCKVADLLAERSGIRFVLLDFWSTTDDRPDVKGIETLPRIR